MYHMCHMYHMYQSFAPQHQASGVYWQRVAFRQTLRQCVILPIELPQPPPFNLLQPLLTFGSLFLSGGADLRKLTTVYYLNHSWRGSLGGLFRIFHPPPNHEKFTDIEPRGDRLIVFWSVFSNSITAHSSSPCSPQSLLILLLLAPLSITAQMTPISFFFSLLSGQTNSCIRLRRHTRQGAQMTIAGL